MFIIYLGLFGLIIWWGLFFWWGLTLHGRINIKGCGNNNQTRADNYLADSKKNTTHKAGDYCNNLKLAWCELHNSGRLDDLMRGMGIGYGVGLMAYYVLQKIGERIAIF